MENMEIVDKTTVKQLVKELQYLSDEVLSKLDEDKIKDLKISITGAHKLADKIQRVDGLLQNIDTLQKNHDAAVLAQKLNVKELEQNVSGVMESIHRNIIDVDKNMIKFGSNLAKNFDTSTIEAAVQQAIIKNMQNLKNHVEHIKNIQIQEWDEFKKIQKNIKKNQDEIEISNNKFFGLNLKIAFLTFVAGVAIGTGAMSFMKQQTYNQLIMSNDLEWNVPKDLRYLGKEGMYVAAYKNSENVILRDDAEKVLIRIAKFKK